MRSVSAYGEEPEEEKAERELTHCAISSGATDCSRAASLHFRISELSPLFPRPFSCVHFTAVTFWGFIDVEANITINRNVVPGVLVLPW